MVTVRNEKEVAEGKFFAAISYISFLCIASLLLKKDNKFALYHGKQGLVVFVLEVVFFIFSIIPFLGWLLGTFALLLLFFISIWCILQALLGNCNRVPLISDIADKIVL